MEKIYSIVSRCCSFRLHIGLANLLPLFGSFLCFCLNEGQENYEPKKLPTAQRENPFLGLLLGLCHFFGILLAIDLAECQICICRPANTMDVKIICPNDRTLWTMTNECKTVKSETHFESFSQHWRHETGLLWQRTNSPPARTPSHWTRTGSPSESS